VSHARILLNQYLKCSCLENCFLASEYLQLYNKELSSARLTPRLSNRVKIYVDAADSRHSTQLATPTTTTTRTGLVENTTNTLDLTTTFPTPFNDTQTNTRSLTMARTLNAMARQKFSKAMANSIIA
jgi:hypothetical protein